MLDGKTLEWLEARKKRLKETGMFAPYFVDKVGLHWFDYSLIEDWKDCAEFEARLNKHLLAGEEIDKPCSHMPMYLACPYTDEWNSPCEWCTLKELRLLVEAEMEKK